MTCKISFFKHILETLKRHIASTFACCMVFFIQLIVIFLRLQNIANNRVAASWNYDSEMIKYNIQRFTHPSFYYCIPVMIVALILAFDYFRYLHSKKQVDFYESLPITRRHRFALNFTTSFLVFLVPFLLVTGLELVFMMSFHLGTSIALHNVFWNTICLIFVFLITWITGAFSMIVTGHNIVAGLTFVTVASYMPLWIRFIFPVYASTFFKTYVSDDTKLYLLEYLSPVGVAAKLMKSFGDKWTLADHKWAMLAIVLSIVLLMIISYNLFCKRPSEAAGRAMVYENVNPIIRVLIVIPLSLYLGLYLSMMTTVSSKIWMVVGFLIGAILIHGVIESIFQFDICGLWANKLQMALCFVVSLLIASVFWFDLIGFNQYLPDKTEVESVVIQIGDTSSYRRFEKEPHGLTGEYIECGLTFLEQVIEEDLDGDSNLPLIQVQYRLKNESVQHRNYYADLDGMHELVDSFFPTKMYKEDICELYSLDSSSVDSVGWNDMADTLPLMLSDSERDLLFETYMAEFTPFTYFEMSKQVPLGCISITYPYEDYLKEDISCYVYPSFTQTIRLLEKYISSDETISDYGTLDRSLLERYPIKSLEVYREEYFLTSDADIIDALKDDLIVYQSCGYNKKGYINTDIYYEASLEMETRSSSAYVSVLIPKEAFDSVIR